MWGSYWVSGKWGFACCHSLIKNSFCTGEAGKRAARSGGIIGMSRKKSTGGGDSDADEHRVTSLVEVNDCVCTCICECVLFILLWLHLNLSCLFSVIVRGGGVTVILAKSTTGDIVSCYFKGE